MLEGFYSTLSGMLVQQRTLNVLSNNITNIKTPGYRAERVVTTSFHEELAIRQERGEKINIGTIDPIHLVRDVITDKEPSSLVSSERPFDMAIVGDGYFNVQSGDQQYITRNGSFDMDDEGYLILPGMGRVLGEEGPIQVNGSSFTVTEDGSVFDENGEQIEKLLITRPPEDTQLEKFTNGMYVAPENAEPVEADNFSITQFALETANYDINKEYSLIMESQRAFQACSQALKMLDTVAQKAATQIASI